EPVRRSHDDRPLSDTRNREIDARGRPSKRDTRGVWSIPLPHVLVLTARSRVSRRAPRSLQADLAAEAHALPATRTTEALLIAGVADRLTGGIYAAGDRRVGNDPPVPDRFDQVVLGDDALAIANQIFEQIEDQRLDRDDLRAAAQFASIRVERIVFEPIG